MARRLDPKIVPYRHADGRTVSYRVRVRVDGRQTTETFTSEAAAAVFVARCKDPNIGVARAVELRDREDAASPGYVPTLAEMLEYHVETLTGVEDRTRQDYLDLAKRSWLPRLGAYRVDELEDRDVAAWLNAVAGTKAPKTIENEHSLLSATLGTAIRKRYITLNPAKGLKLPRQRPGQDTGEDDDFEPKFLTHSEFDTLFAEIREPWRPMVTWMFGMGTRFSETTAHQERDLDLAAGHWLDADTWESAPTARVARAWKARPRKLGPPKSERSLRTIVMPPEVAAVAEAQLTGQGGAFLFRTAAGAPIRHSNFYNRVWKPATLRATICPDHRDPKCRCLSGKPELCLVHTEKDGAGHWILPKPCGCAGTLSFRPRIHDARHTHASWLIAQGVRLDVIQARLGHEDYLTTQRLYGHLLPDAHTQAGIAASLAFAQTKLAIDRPEGPHELT